MGWGILIGYLAVAGLAVTLFGAVCRMGGG